VCPCNQPLRVGTDVYYEYVVEVCGLFQVVAKVEDTPSLP